MTNRIAIILFLLISASIAADIYFEWGVSIFLARRLLELTEYLAFWR